MSSHFSGHIQDFKFVGEKNSSSGGGGAGGVTSVLYEHQLMFCVQNTCSVYEEQASMLSAPVHDTLVEQVSVHNR